VKFIEGSSIFLNYWILAVPFADKIKEMFDMSILPGSKEGLSGSTVCGFNVGINSLLLENDKVSQTKNVTNSEKLDAAVHAVKFITSKNTQRQLFMNGDSVTAIPSLLNEQEVCDVKDCEMFHNIQAVLTRPHERFGGLFNKFEYDDKFRKYAEKYLYNKDADLNEILKKIEDITKIYYISYNETKFSIGYVSIFLVCFISVLMLFSLIFLFFENFQPFFRFLSLDSWILLIIGLIMILSSIITLIGEVTSMKCHLRLILCGTGLTLYLVNILYELIINVSENFKLKEWVEKHKYLFILIFLLFDIVLNALAIIYPYNTKDRIIDDGQNFKICKMYSKFGKSMIYLIVINKMLLLLVITFFAFIEWNLKSIYYEVRFIVSAVYSNILLIFIYFIVDISYINNYLMQFIIEECLIIFISISSYIFLYGYKLCLAFLRKNNVKSSFINDINKNFINESEFKSKNNTFNDGITSETNYCKTIETISSDKKKDNDSNNNVNTNRMSYIMGFSNLFTKILDLHYATGDDYDNEDDNEYITQSGKI